MITHINKIDMKNSKTAITVIATASVFFCIMALFNWGYIFIGIFLAAYAWMSIPHTPESRPKAPDCSERRYNKISKKTV
jgi:hypothetical protein